MAQQTTNLVVGKKESVVDEFLLLNPHQIPLLSLIGFGDPVTNVKHEWVEDALFEYSSTAAAAATNTATTISVAAGDGALFRAGQLIQIGDEVLKVDSVAGDTLTVQRGQLGTTAAAVNANDVIEILYNDSVEGANARAARAKQRVMKENYTQIFDDTIEISGSMMEVAQYGIEDEYARQRLHKQTELALQLEKALIGGVGYNNGTTRYMKGARNFISSNVVVGNGTAKLTADNLNTALEKIYVAGGFQSAANHVIMVPAVQKRAIADAGKSQVRYGVNDRIEGRVVDMFVSDFGEFPILLNNNLRATEAMILDLNRMAVRPLGNRSFSHEYMGKQGDYIKGQILGEYTLEFKQEAAHAKITNLGK
jgi:Family of unknown function (DUF5309)